MMSESDTTSYPYPLRPSELVGRPEFGLSLGVKPLELTDQERTELGLFDDELFDGYKEAKKGEGEVGNHVIYPEAFLTPEGKRIFLAVYRNPSLGRNIRRIAEQKGIEKSDEIYDAAFEDIVSIAKNEEKFGEFCERGTRFENLGKVLKDDNLILKISPKEREESLDEQRIVRLFFSTDLRRIPERIRKLLNNYSADIARDHFKQIFRQNHGEVSDANVPKRIGKIVSPTEFRRKLEGLRGLKASLKERRKLLENQEKGNLREAKLILLDLYQRQVNLKIAELYPTARLLSESGVRRRKIHREIFKNIHGFSKIPRAMERIDHFLRGVGLQIGPDGLFQTIPSALSDYVERKIKASKDTNEDYEKYNARKINAEGMRDICEEILASYVGKEGDWKVEISKTSKSMSVNLPKKVVRIPADFDRGLVDALAVAAHEVEGHVLRALNSEGLEESLPKIVKEVVGRSGILSEAAAMGVESKTKELLVKVARTAAPHYYLALKEKERGGNFASCFRVYFESKAKWDYNLSLEEALKDEKVYDELFDSAYSRTLRLFRSNTPLGEEKGYIPTSEQLEYAEQELIGGALMTPEAVSLGLDNLLYVKGVDLYSLRELLRLGVLNLKDVQRPKMVAVEIGKRSV